MTTTLTVNGEPYAVESPADTPLLWVLRDALGLTGTKYSCGKGVCGACTVHVNGEARRSCTMPMSAAAGKEITTIEGLASGGPHPVQQAWIEERVPQCGYCQPGQIMMAAALLANSPDPTDAQIDESMSEALCRCGTYQRIRRAIHRAAKVAAAGSSDGGVARLGTQIGPGEPVSRGASALLPVVGALALSSAGAKAKVSRRGFLQIAAAAGAGLVIGVYLPGCRGEPTPTPGQTLPSTATPTPTATTAAGDTMEPSAPATALPTATVEPTATPNPEARLEPDLYLRLDGAGAITLITPKSELGQGIHTALAMTVAEELMVDWTAINHEMAPVNPAFGKLRTSGSSSMVDCYTRVRAAAAEARTLLIMAAAQTWQVDEDSCYAQAGRVIHEPSGRQLTYADLVETAAALPPVWDVKYVDPEEYTVIGQSLGRLDNPQIVDGSAIFGLDVQAPEMLYAVVARCPVAGGSVVSYDAAPAEAIEGVQLIAPIESGIAVVADNSWSALLGRQALDVTWDEGGNAGLSDDMIHQELAARFDTSTETDQSGSITAFYEIPHQAHAAMEPMNCVADVRADRAEIWAPTQNPESASAVTVSLTGLPRENVTVHVPLVGGGFGRRLDVDYVEEAVEISSIAGTPIKLIWTREDDIQRGRYHPYSYTLASVKTDRPQRPALRSETSSRLPSAAWRSVWNFDEAFARECALDELAAELGRDDPGASGDPGRLGQPFAQWLGPGNRLPLNLECDPNSHGGRTVREPGRYRPGSSRGMRYRLRIGDQPGYGGGPDGRGNRLGPDGRSERRDHPRRRPGATKQLRRPSHHTAGRDAGCQGPFCAQLQATLRRRGNGRAAHNAGRAQCRVRRHR
jgi:aerobic-type carbon monoxide dehydrogenase small subunit (CoxS/CutS family)